MSSASESPAGDLLWQQARTDYETIATDLNTIAQALGISRARLIAEALNRGWKLRGARSSSTRATIQRFKDLLQKRLTQLEGNIDEIATAVTSATSERDIRPVTMGAGVALPLAGELVDYLQTLDWRQYVLASDRKNLAVLAIVGALGLMAIVLRHMTTGPVGTKD